MQRTVPISVIIPCFNEADILELCLRSVQAADEIIVVDAFSSDGSDQIAQKYATRFLQRSYSGPADQKNWAIPQAQHEWVLLLDADEMLTPGLWLEISKIVAENPNGKDAWSIRRKSQFMGAWIRFSGWQNDRVIRLIRRDVCQYPEQQVHEEISVLPARLGHCKGLMEHYTYKNLGHFLDKQRRYASWSALDKAASTGPIGIFHLLVKPAFRFFRHYILKLGILDGYRGFIISSVMAWSVFLRYLYIMEYRRQASASTPES